MSKLNEILSNMKDLNNLIGLKTSFEDEGATLFDLREVLSICTESSLETTVKVGGCEAKTDIINCILHGVDNIVAPMVETEFSFRKFKNLCTSVVQDVKKKPNFFINVETITAINNLEKILTSNDGFLKGIIFGRTDIVGSLGLDKNQVDSEAIYELIEKASLLAKKYNLTTAIGGNISVNSVEFINKLVSKNLLDKVETRIAICDLKTNNNIQEFIINAIELEKVILSTRIEKLELLLKPWKQRLIAIQSRTSFLERVQKNEKHTLVIDFDNVIHNMDKGFYDGTIYGDMVEGTREKLEILSSKYRLVIYSCKCNPNRPLINGKQGKQLIIEWLREKKIDHFIDEITFEKPNAVAYIDDKAIRFENWEDCIKELEKYRIL